jgi:hypothetical protein
VANILPCTPHLIGAIRKRRFRVEWDDNDGLIRERYFDSYRAAERFAFDIERRLLRDIMEDILEPG